MIITNFNNLNSCYLAYVNAAVRQSWEGFHIWLKDNPIRLLNINGELAVTILV